MRKAEAASVAHQGPDEGKSGAGAADDRLPGQHQGSHPRKGDLLHLPFLPLAVYTCVRLYALAQSLAAACAVAWRSVRLLN